MPPSSHRSPEDELLLLLVHGQHSPERATRLRALLGASPDWTVLLHQAGLHGVVPLVAHHLQQLDPATIPPATVVEFQRRAFQHDVRNMLLVTEVCQVLQQLMMAGIPVIPLKGVALAHALYRNTTLRVSSDLDILVRRAQIPHAVRVLEADGYRAEGPWQRWVALSYHMEIPLIPRDSGRRYAVDLHWGLLAGDPRSPDIAEECWAAARPATVLGVEAWAMSPEWELLFLVLHAARSQWQALKWLVDIREICWAWELNWQMVWAIAHKWGWEEVLQFTLGACQTFWELPTACSVDRIRWPSWLPRFPEPPRQSRWGNLRVMYLLLPHWNLRISYVLRLIGTSSPTDYYWLPLPGALSPLYYVLRPLRWMILGGKLCLRAVLQRCGV